LSDQGGTPQGDEQGPQQAQEAQTQGLDLGPINERLDGLSQTLERFGAQLPQQAPEQQPDPWDLGDILGNGQQPPAQQEQYFESEPQQAPFDPQAFAQAIRNASQTEVQQHIEQALGPIQETMGSLQADLDANYLIEAYPEFANEEVAERVVQRADELAARFGISPAAARSAGFIEQVYLAEKYQQQARGEVPVGDLTNQGLEGPGGVQPSAQQQADIAQQILAAGSPQRDFWSAVRGG
jgi:hypothetical protein